MKINYDLFIHKAVMTYGNGYTTFEGHSMNAIYYLFRKIMGNFPVTKRAQCDGSFHLRTVVNKYQWCVNRGVNSEVFLCIIIHVFLKIKRLCPTISLGSWSGIIYKHLQEKLHNKFQFMTNACLISNTAVSLQWHVRM